MSNGLLQQCFISRDVTLLKRVLKTSDEKNFYQKIIYLINQEVFNTKEKPVDRTVIINYLISVFYDEVHNTKNMMLIESLLNEYMIQLNQKLVEYSHEEINEEYYVIKHTKKKIKSLLKIINDYIKTNKTEFEYNLIWFLINDIESFDYLEYLISKNPKILNQHNLEGTIFNNFLNLYYQTIIHYNKNNRDDKIEFYDKILTLFLTSQELENNNIKFDEIIVQIVIEINNPKISEEQKQRLIQLKNKFLRTIKFPPILKSSIETLPKPWQVGTRLDLRKYETISIDDNVINDRGIPILFDDAFTLFKNGNGYMLYVHCPDVPSYLCGESQMKKEAYKKIFSMRKNCEYISLFDDKFCRKNLSLEPNVDRFAISFALEISSNGTIDSIDFFETIIRNKRSFCNKEASSIIDYRCYDPYQPLLLECVNLCELISKHQKITGNQISETFTNLVGKYTAQYFYDNNIPTIYRNCIPLKKTVNEEQRLMLKDYASKEISEEYGSSLIKRTDHSYRAFFDINNYGHCILKYMAYTEPTNPIRSYISTTILEGIKTMVINRDRKSQSDDQYQRKYMEIANQANAIEAVYLKK